MFDEEVRELVLKHSLANAVQHGGKADPKPVMGKVLAERPDLKPLARNLIELVREVVNYVNSLSLEEQKSLLADRWPELLEKERTKREERKELPPLPNVERYDKVVTRFSPNPDCVLHIGSARAAILSHDYARMYGGVFYLRFEDTDPRTKKPVLEFYDAIREDLEWLGCKWDAEFIQSDRLPIYYEYAEKLISDGNAYVCTCKPEEFKKRVLQKQPCPCRGLDPSTHLERWVKMLEGEYREGEAVVRIKTDLEHPNPAIRDWPALRIIDTKVHKHPRTGDQYIVWPLYNFACGIDDGLMGITHIVRGKEHMSNEIRQRYLFKHLGWEYPTTMHYGRLRVVGAVLSKSKIRAGVESGQFWGYDDPRLPTLAALRRRGISPEAIRRIMVEVGPKPVEATISWENLYAYNRKIVDEHANRFFVVLDPVKMVVRGLEEARECFIHLHPSFPERGFRRIVLTPKNGSVELWVSKADLPLLKPSAVVRLIGFANVSVDEASEALVSASIHSWSPKEAKEIGASFVHWVPAESSVEVEVAMPDGFVAHGVGEGLLASQEVGSIIQMERVGYGRIDSVSSDRVVIYFSHP